MRQIIRIILVLIALSAIGGLINRGCQKEIAENPRISIVWPAKFAELDNSLLIQISGWQRGIIKSTYQDIPDANAGLRMVVYYLQDQNKVIQAVVVCVIDSQTAGVKKVALRSTVPISDNSSQRSDYIVNESLGASDGWKVFEAKRL